MPKITDKELVKLIKKGNDLDYAFNLLLKKYQEKVYWHIRKIVLNHDDADDLTQNTFIKVYENIHKFRHESELFTWIYKIATNQAISFINQKTRKYFLPIGDADEYLINSLKADEYFDGDELQINLQKVLLKLPEKQRIVFNMKYFDEMKYEEMAKILKTSIGALKASYHHAVKKIEKLLDEN